VAVGVRVDPVDQRRGGVAEARLHAHVRLELRRERARGLGHLVAEAAAVRPFGRRRAVHLELDAPGRGEADRVAEGGAAGLLHGVADLAAVHAPVARAELRLRLRACEGAVTHQPLGRGCDAAVGRSVGLLQRGSEGQVGRGERRATLLALLSACLLARFAAPFGRRAFLAGPRGFASRLWRRNRGLSSLSLRRLWRL